MSLTADEEMMNAWLPREMVEMVAGGAREEQNCHTELQLITPLPRHDDVTRLPAQSFYLSRK